MISSSQKLFEICIYIYCKYIYIYHFLRNCPNLFTNPVDIQKMETVEVSDELGNLNQIAGTEEENMRIT